MRLSMPLKGARKDYYKKKLLGSNDRRGWIMSFVVYLLLITIAFIYLYPVLYMFSRSLMGKNDLLDASAKWIPSSVTLSNYHSAIATMDYWNSLLKNLAIALVSTLCQVFVCSLAGYAFARYKFPGKTLWMGVLILSFLLPAQTIAVPNFLLFNSFKMVDGTLKPFIITSILGQGFKSCLCILIFYNFHRQVPQSLIEAAEIDGAGHIKAYFQIAIPLSAAAIIVVTLFSFVWYWNEVDLVRTYLGSTNDRNTGLTTLMLELNKFEDSYNAVYATHAQSTTSTNRLNDAIKMAGTMLSIAPMMLMYFFLQKQFVESVDKAGITGE
ncbi:MAG: carbohydrate ABC transporter permease [Clostridiales bacterium]|nr:carbohydrate ABC transporter permease [Clostridiales bacterium]